MSDHHQQLSSFHHMDYTASSDTVLHIPRAQDWSKGVPICLQENSSHVYFRVLENLNRGTGIEPNFRTMLTDAAGEQVLALVKHNNKSFTPHWCIYLATSATSCPRRRGSGDMTSGDRDQLPPNMALYGLLYNTGEFKLTRCVMSQRSNVSETDDDGMLDYRYNSIRGGKVCCCGSNSRRLIEITAADDDDSTAFVRNQVEETMRVIAGENLLVAAALAYVLDRRYKPLGSTAERKERMKQARRQAQILGFKTGTGAAARRSSSTASGDDLASSKDKYEHLHIKENSKSHGADAAMLTVMAELKEPKRRMRLLPARSKEEKTAAPVRAGRKRRKRQLSAAILEMEGDVSTEHLR